MLFPAVVALSLATSVFATVFITFPVSSTVLTGGQPASVTWIDSSDSPSLAEFGKAKFAIYIGNANQQTELQLLSPSTDVSVMSSLSFTPDPTIGPDSNEYFIRVESLTAKDPSNPKYPALAFSAKFTLTGMQGEFSSAEQAQIDGQSTAPIGPSTTSVTTLVATSGATSATSWATSSVTSSATTSTATVALSSGQTKGTPAVSTAGTAPTSTSTSASAAQYSIPGVTSFIFAAVAVILVAL